MRDYRALRCETACGRARLFLSLRTMQINGDTRVFMILGDPVVQVRAPEMDESEVRAMLQAP